MTSAIVIALSTAEKAYLKDAKFLPDHLAAIVNSCIQGEASELHATREQAEEFRAAFTGQLARSGFDQEYAPTSEGSLLEGLIDKFFMP